MCDLLRRCDSVPRYSHSLANPSNALRVFPFVSEAIRPGLRCVGELHAAGIFADIVRSAAYTASSISGFSAARTTHVFSQIRKRDKVGGRKSEKIRL